jgi:bacterial/archaeal transporter family protein
LSGTLLLLFLLARGKSNEIYWDKWGLIWSIGAGLWVGTAEMLSFTVSGMGVPATQSIPIIIGGSVLFGAILGFFLLGEVMVLHGWSGVVMLTIGIGMVATDPGEKVEEGDGGDDVDSPPLCLWIGPALCCAMAYALYNICIKKGSATINPILGGVILQFVAAMFGSILLGGILLEGATLHADKAGIVWACLAGVAVGAAELLSFGVSGMGVQATQSIPILIGGSVMFGAVLGIFMLGETLELQGWIGVVLLMSGIGMVATDPGEKMPGH